MLAIGRNTLDKLVGN